MYKIQKLSFGPIAKYCACTNPMAKPYPRAISVLWDGNSSRFRTFHQRTLELEWNEFSKCKRSNFSKPCSDIELASVWEGRTRPLYPLHVKKWKWSRIIYGTLETYPAPINQLLGLSTVASQTTSLNLTQIGNTQLLCKLLESSLWTSCQSSPCPIKMSTCTPAMTPTFSLQHHVTADATNTTILASVSLKFPRSCAKPHRRSCAIVRVQLLT